MTDIQDLARSALEEPASEAALVELLKVGAKSQVIVRRLQQYARRPVEGDFGRIYARRILTAAGLSWDQ